MAVLGVETIRMSSKGQVVIPQDVRKQVHAEEGTVFAVVGSGDTIMLKKVETPSKQALLKDLEAIAREGRRRLEKKGLNEGDLRVRARG